MKSKIFFAILIFSSNILFSMNSYNFMENEIISLLGAAEKNPSTYEVVRIENYLFAHKEELSLTVRCNVAHRLNNLKKSLALIEHYEHKNVLRTGTMRADQHEDHEEGFCILL